MKKLLLILFLFLNLSLSGFAADTKVSDLPEDTTPSVTGYIMEVDDPTGTPTSKKVSIANLLHAADGVQINSFTNNKNDLENGTTVTSTVLNWTVTGTLTSESIDNGVGSITPASTRTKTHTSTYSTNRTYILTVGDGNTTDTASTSIRFLNTNYYGPNASVTLNDSQINALSHGLGTNRIQVRNGITAAQQHIHIIYPAVYGAATFTVNGLLNNDFTCVTQDHTNSSSATVSYIDCYTNNLLTGTFNIGVN